MNRAIALLAFGQTFAWAGLYYIFPALLLRWEQDLGWSKAEIAGAITVAVLISAFGSPLAGRIIDIGRGPVLMAGSCAVGGAGLLALSSVDLLWQFYLVWALIGLAMAGCLYEPCFALVTRTRGRDAKTAIVVITLVAGFASTISFPAMHTLSEAMGWRVAVLLTGLIVIAVVAPALWLGAGRLEKERETIRPPAPRPEAGVADRFLRRPAFWYLAVGFALAALVHGSTLHHLLSFLDERGVSGDMAAFAAAFIGPMQVAGRLAMMASERYISHHGVALTAFVGLGLSVVPLLFGFSSPAGLSGFVVLFGAAWGTMSILRPVLARDILGERDFGAKSGALALPFLVGSAAAPYLGAVAWGIGGYSLMFGSAIALSAVGCMLYLAAHKAA